MVNSLGPTRLALTAGVLLFGFILLHTVSHGEPVVPHQPLRTLPYTIAEWSDEEYPLSEHVLQALKVSDYTNRLYSGTDRVPVQLYVGYYVSQKTGDTMHSPKNCLPGSGWDPVHAGLSTVAISGGQQIVVNDYVIQRDQVKQLVFYWYQGRGRVIASEYSGKFWMVADAISRNRTDGALVRLVTPMSDGEAAARERLIRFTQYLYPGLDSIIPK